jgi:hypothetical protein
VAQCRLPALPLLFLALFAGACGAAGGRQGPDGPRVHFRALSDSAVARALYDVRIYTERTGTPGAFDLVHEQLGIEPQGALHSAFVVAPCIGAPAPGRLALAEVTASAFDGSGQLLAEPQTQSAVFSCVSSGDFTANDIDLPDFVFTFLVPGNNGFADVTVEVREVRWTFKADVTRLLPLGIGDGTSVRAKSAVTGLLVQAGSRYAGPLPDNYLLAAVETAARCLACGPGGTPAPLPPPRVFTGAELAALGADRSSYLNAAWTMPEGAPLTSEAGWRLEAIGVSLPPGGAPLFELQGAYVEYAVDSRFEGDVYHDTRSATARQAIVAARAAERDARHLYFLSNGLVPVAGSGSVPGLELAFAIDASPDEVSALEKRSYAAGNGASEPVAVAALTALALEPGGTRFSVVLAEAGASSRILGAVRCEVSFAFAGCETDARGFLAIRSLRDTPPGSP